MKAGFFFFLPLILGLAACGASTKADSSAGEMAKNDPSISIQLLDTDSLPEKLPLFRGNAPKTFVSWACQQLLTPTVTELRIMEIKTTAIFLIDREGKISNVVISESPHPVIATRLLHVIENAPDWTPARDENDEPVAVRCVAYINLYGRSQTVIIRQGSRPY